MLNTIFTATIYKNKVQVFFFKCHGVCYERAFHWYLYNLPQTENRVSTNDFVERNFFLCKILIWFITFHSKLILFKRISKLKASCLAKVTLSKLKNKQRRVKPMRKTKCDSLITRPILKTDTLTIPKVIFWVGFILLFSCRSSSLQLFCRKTVLKFVGKFTVESSLS